MTIITLYTGYSKYTAFADHNTLPVRTVVQHHSKKKIENGKMKNLDKTTDT